jgi:predicted nuclease with TOPRIM domain
MKDYLYHGKGKLVLKDGTIEGGEFEYGFLTQGVRVEPWENDHYSIDILLQDSETKQIKKTYYKYSDYNEVLTDLEKQTDLAEKSTTGEEQEKLKLYERAKAILGEINKEREAAESTSN